MSKYDNLKGLCRALGYHGICPEALEKVGRIQGYLNDIHVEEYHEFMAAAREMFAPAPWHEEEHA